VVQAQKTWRKHNAVMILATQSIKELEGIGDAGQLWPRAADKNLPGQSGDEPEVYRDAFHLNDTELDLISGLIPPGQMLIRKAQTSKKVQLNVDRITLDGNQHARDNLKKRDYSSASGVRTGFATCGRSSIQARALAVSTFYSK